MAREHYYGESGTPSYDYPIGDDDPQYPMPPLPPQYPMPPLPQWPQYPPPQYPMPPQPQYQMPPWWLPWLYPPGAPVPPPISPPTPPGTLITGPRIGPPNVFGWDRYGNEWKKDMGPAPVPNPAFVGGWWNDSHELY